MTSSGSAIVSWDFSNGKDVGVLIVGRQNNGVVEIVNAFQDLEAEELYLRLTTPITPIEQKISFVEGK